MYKKYWWNVREINVLHTHVPNWCRDENSWGMNIPHPRTRMLLWPNLPSRRWQSWAVDWNSSLISCSRARALSRSLYRRGKELSRRLWVELPAPFPQQPPTSLSVTAVEMHPIFISYKKGPSLLFSTHPQLPLHFNCNTFNTRYTPSYLGKSGAIHRWRQAASLYLILLLNTGSHMKDNF